MFRNYLAAALRNLVRNKLYAAINVIGLTVGFTAALLIALFVRDEMTYDTWAAGHENVYRLSKAVVPPDGLAPPLRGDSTSPIEAVWVKEEIPGVVTAARLWPEQHGIRQGRIEANETLVWADPDIFELFPLQSIEGDLAQALRQPDGVVITRRLARKYFGHEAAVGETLEVDRKTLLRVTAVVADLPSNSHLNIDIFAAAGNAISPLAAPPPPPAGLGKVLTYLRLAPNTLAAVTAALPDMIDRRFPPNSIGPYQGKVKVSDVYSYVLQPLSAIHMIDPKGRFSFTHHGILRPSGDKVMVSALLITGILIVLVAIANFVNLMTARAGRRAVEVGIRKTTGAQRRDLMAQFLGESFLYVGASMVVTVALVKISLPAFNAFVDRGIELACDPVLTAVIAGLFLIAGALGGLYPAFVLSAFRPVAVLKSSAGGTGGLCSLRNVLVIAQFAILTSLIVATAVIGRQTVFAINDGFRLDTDRLLIVSTPCLDTFKERVTALPGIRGVACVDRPFLGEGGAVALTTLADGTQTNLYNVGIGPGVLELSGLRPIAGRFFSQGGPSTALDASAALNNVVINETAVRRLKFASPEAAIGQSLPLGRAEIIGVVPDFPLQSLRDPIEAVSFFQPRTFAYLVAKLDSHNVSETLRAIDRAWEGLGTGRPIMRRFYDQHVQARYIDIVRQTQAFVAFSITAIFIACLGLFGLSAFTAERRTKEIGIRKAMGAGTADILRLLIWQFTKPVLWANVIAWPVAYVVMRRWLEGFAYHIDLDLWIFLAATALALAIAILTVAGHALLVARTQPVTALRYE